MTYPHDPRRPVAWHPAEPMAPAVRRPDGPIPTYVHPFSAEPATEVTYQRRETRHGLHLIITLLTFGLWAIVGWPWVWLWNRFGPRERVVTRRY